MCTVQSLHSNYPEYRRTISPLPHRLQTHWVAARRTLEGNPIPQSLLDASEVIYQSRATDPADEGSVVGNAMEQFTDSVDHEAVIMLALQMVNYRTKGSSDHVRAFGTTILKSQKSAEALLFMAKVLESLPPRERDEILQSMKPFAPEK